MIVFKIVVWIKILPNKYCRSAFFALFSFADQTSATVTVLHALPPIYYLLAHKKICADVRDFLLSML